MSLVKPAAVAGWPLPESPTSAQHNSARRAVHADMPEVIQR